MRSLAEAMMRKAFAGFAGAALLGTIAGGRAGAQTSQESTQSVIAHYQQVQQEKVNRLKRGIVRIEAQKETREAGTGIVLSFTPQSVTILTALHVVEGAQSISVFFYDSPTKRYAAHKLPKHSTAEDLAVIEVDSTAGLPVPGDLPTFNFVENSDLQQGEHLTTVNGDWVAVPNSLTRLSHDGDPQRFEYSNTSVGEGFSGGPIFDDYMNIVGMHDALTGDGSYAVAVKIDAALQVLAALDYSVPKAGPDILPDFGRGQDSGPGTGKSVTRCAKGCEATLGSLQPAVHHAVDARGRAYSREDVYQLPADWPNGGMFVHVLSYPSVPNMVQIRLAQTDKAGDQDTMAGMALLQGSTARGYIRDQGGVTWTLMVENPNFGGTWNPDALVIKVAPIR